MQTQLYRLCLRSKNAAVVVDAVEMARLIRRGDVVSVKEIGQKQPYGTPGTAPVYSPAAATTIAKKFSGRNGHADYPKEGRRSSRERV